MHYSFDYAQQVHYPSNPMQPGPIYLKTPRKCGIFGVFCEAVPSQVNSMKPLQLGKVQIQQSVMCTTSFNNMVLAKLMSIFTQTTVVGKTKTTSFCGTLHGGL